MIRAGLYLTLLFISHDLSLVKNISDRIAVMYLGKICELAESDKLYEKPLHPYTFGLIKAIPSLSTMGRVNEENMELSGEIPSPIDPPQGCRFHPRCPNAEYKCEAEEPKLREIWKEHYVACHFPLSK